MRDKDLMGLIVTAFFIVYFYPFTILKFLSIGVILFFSPGFFILKTLHKDMEYEELILLSFPVSIGIVGALAIIFSVFSILSWEIMLISSAVLNISGYVFSSSQEIKTPKFHFPSRIISVLIILMLVAMGIWLYFEFTTTPSREMDMGIVSWPKNASVNSVISFEIYVKNQNYGNARCVVAFTLNNRSINNQSFSIKNGEYRIMMFNAITNVTGKNLASFDLYVNGKYYTNVHIYFHVNASSSKSLI